MNQKVAVELNDKPGPKLILGEVTLGDLTGDVGAKFGQPKRDGQSPQDDPDALYDPTNMAIRTSDIPQLRARIEIRLPNRIIVDKPSKQAYFRHHPDYYLKTFLIKHEASRRWYYPATGEVRDRLSEFVRTVELFGIITMLSDFRWWPIPISEIGNDWNDSAREIVEASIHEWVGFKSLEGRYELRYPAGEHADPTWPTASLKELLARAFRGNFTIKDMNHNIAKSLLGK